MLIDLKNMEAAIVPNMRGGEKDAEVKSWNDKKAKIVQIRLIPGASVGLHTHVNDCEVIYVLEGSGKVLDNGEYVTISAGQSQYCPKGDDHALINDGNVDLIYYAAILEQ